MMKETSVVNQRSKGNQTTWYVYLLCDPDTGVPFYVGKGTGDRAQQHARYVESVSEPNEAKKNIIRRILGQGKQVLVKKIAEFNNEEDAYIYEQATINAYFGSLTNMRPGGGGFRSLERPRLSVTRDFPLDPNTIIEPTVAAEMLEIPLRTLMRLIHQGYIEAFQVGRRWRLLVSMVEQYRQSKHYQRLRLRRVK